MASQRAQPTGGYLRELSPSLNRTSQQDTLDWSYYAGLDERTRIAGTHISDQANSIAPNVAAGTWQASSDCSRQGVTSWMLTMALLVSYTLELLSRHTRL